LFPGRPPSVCSPSTQDLGHYKRFGGVVIEEGEGRHVAEALGNYKAVILSNHGLLTTGASVEAAVFWFMSLEKCCHTQLLADAAAAGKGGETVKIQDEDAGFTYNTIGTDLAGWFSAKPEFDVVMKEHGDEILS
jgi:ribulose-5-phosphate 4-epimerase/fuculose-1-phosphate aldolase